MVFFGNNQFQILKRLIKEAFTDGGDQFAVFDFDNTCIKNDIGEATLNYFCRNKLLKDKHLLGKEYDEKKYHEEVFKHYYGLLDAGKTKEAYIFCSKIVSGFKPLEITSLVQKLIKDEGDEIKTSQLYGLTIEKGLAIQPKVKKLIDFLQENNVDVWIVSSSNQVLVQVAAQYYKISCEVIGVKNKIVNGLFSAELEEPLPMFEGKVDCIKKFIKTNQQPLLIVGDSENDFSMLEYAKIKVVVDRKSPFSEKARDLGWFLI